MNKIIMIIAVMVLPIAGISQEKDSNFYLKRSKNQTTAAWLLLAGGTGLLAAGLFIDKGELVSDNWFWYDEYKNDGLKSGLALSGVILATGSIPFFILAANNKNKGIKLELKNEAVSVINKQSIVTKQIPSLSLKIPL